MKIIIIGCGKMGRYLTTVLAKDNYNITVIDKNIEILNRLNETSDVSIIEGNGLIVDTLLEANVNESDIVICTMKNDEDNILASLLSKKIGCKNTISRVRNPEYLKSLDFIKDELGLSMAINPELLTAKEIEKDLRFSENVKVSYLAKGKVELIKFKIKDDSNLINVCIKDLKSIIKCNVLVVAVEKDGKYYVPNANYVFKKNDKIVVSALHKDINQFFKAIEEPNIRIKSAMIIGGSKISYYLAKYLTESKVKVKIIETDKSKCDELSEKLDKALIINGDGSDNHLLIEEGIENVDAFIASTGLDEENVVFSMFANSLNIPKVITKINHLNFSSVLENVGIKSIITPHVIASNHIIRYIRSKENSKGGNMESLIRLEENLEVMDFKINNDFKFLEKKLKDIKFKNNMLIVCIKRNDKIIFPTGDDTICEKDNIIIATNLKGIKCLNDIVG